MLSLCIQAVLLISLFPESTLFQAFFLSVVSSLSSSQSHLPPQPVLAWPHCCRLVPPALACSAHTRKRLHQRGRRDWRAWEDPGPFPPPQTLGRMRSFIGFLKLALCISIVTSREKQEQPWVESYSQLHFYVEEAKIYTKQSACMHSHFTCVQLFVTMDCSLPGSTVHGILQARILEWVAMPSSRASFTFRDWTCVSCIAGGFFTTEPSGKSLKAEYNKFTRLSFSEITSTLLCSICKNKPKN